MAPMLRICGEKGSRFEKNPKFGARAAGLRGAFPRFPVAETRRSRRIFRAMTKKERAQFIAETLDEFYPNPPIPLRHKDAFTLLVAVVLSAQCTDKRVNEVTPALFALADTPEAMARLRPEDVEKIIRPCGLSPRKSRAIVSLSKDIAEKHGGRVPADFAALEALDGVGHKTASVVMSQAFGVPAFPVDTHIHRLAARWKLSLGKSVERTERDLKALFPRERWNRLHIQMILYGREHCTARGCDGHVCGICRALNGGKKPPRGKAGGGKK